MSGGLDDHIASVGDWGAEFRCTPRVKDIFKKRKIFLAFADHCPEHQTFLFKDGVAVEPYTVFYTSDPLWSMGSFSFAASRWSVQKPWPFRTQVGRYCSLAPNSGPMDARHPIEWATTTFFTYYEEEVTGTRPFILEAYKDFDYRNHAYKDFPKPLFEITISIGHDVWIARDVAVGQQVSIGTGAVVATGAVVTKNVEPYMIVGGVPARVLRPRFPEKLIERFLKSCWWEFSPKIFDLCDHKNPEKFLDDVERMKESNLLSPFKPERTTFHHILNDLMSET